MWLRWVSLRRDGGMGIGIGLPAGLRVLRGISFVAFLAVFTGEVAAQAGDGVGVGGGGSGNVGGNVGGGGSVGGSVGGGGGHLVIISGLSGEERFARDFLAWGAELADAAVTRYGLERGNVVWLAEDAAAHAGIRARSTRENVGRELRALAARAGAGDRVLIVIFGHGSYQAGASRINLPGPDIDGRQFGLLLDGLREQRVAVVNATSASGGFIQDLAAPNRIVITATKSGMEANETIFGRHFTAALTGDAADADQDGRVSLLEAFEYTRLEVEREYERSNRLQTEHAMLDAVGDGRGATEATAGGPHAQAAASFYLGAGATVAADASPELRALYAEKTRLEGELAELPARRAALPEAEYDAALERLLVALAQNGHAIRQLEGGAR